MTVTPGSGKEGRIWAEYRGLKRDWDYSNSGLPAIRMFLARKWKMPVREVRRIIGLKRRPADAEG